MAKPHVQDVSGSEWFHTARVACRLESGGEGGSSPKAGGEEGESSLGTVNKFHNAFLGLVRRWPHKLAGLWRDGYSSHECTLECLDAPVDEEGRSLEGWEQLHVCSRSDDLPDQMQQIWSRSMAKSVGGCCRSFALDCAVFPARRACDSRAFR